MTTDDADRIIREIEDQARHSQAAREALRMLSDKCRWEAMSRTAVVREWGDPREWIPC